MVSSPTSKIMLCMYLFLLLTLTPLINPYHAEAGRTVRVGVYDTKPLAYFDMDASAHGFFVDMLNSIAEKEQWNVQYVPGTWQEGLDRLKSDEIDMVLCIAYTEERDKYMDFPKEYLLLDWGLIFKSKGSKISSLLDLEGKSVSALKGDVYLTGFKELARQFNVNVKIQEVDQYPEVFKAVESGAVAAGVNGNLYGMLNDTGLSLEQTPIIFTPVKLGYAVNEGKNGDLIAALDRHIAEMKADKASIYHRELERIMGKKALTIPKEAYWLLSGVAAALLLAIAFIVLLKRQVKAKTEHLETEIAERKIAEETLLILKDRLQEQNEELQRERIRLSVQNDELQATEEMLRVQVEEFETSQKLLKESEVSYKLLANEQRIILNSSSVGIIFVKNRKVLWANPAHCTMFGYEVEAVQNMDTTEYYVDRESYEHIGEKAYSFIASGGIYTEDLMMKKKDGSLFWCNLVGQAINPQNLEEGSIWSIQDITERKRSEDQQRHTQKMDVLGQLAGGVAHDFNNMLTGIMAAAELLKFRLSGEDRNMKMVDTILNAASRSAELTHDLLAFSRKGKTETRPVAINDLIASVIALLERTVDKRIHLLTRLDAANPIITGDSTLLQNALLNLGVNSRDAMPEGGTLIYSTEIASLDEANSKYNLSSVTPGRYVQISVSDTGDGIPKEIIDRIFEPFFTTKETGKGTGLGLAAVYGTVRDHNGSVNVFSEPGKGTVFNVFLPLNSDDFVTVEPKTDIITGAGGILLVDDEEIIRSMAHDLLTELGYTVYLAEDGYKAQELYSNHRHEIKLVLLDMIMPKMNGKETYLKLREIDPEVRVMFCSGFHREGTTEELLEFGSKGFIKKPYNMIDLSRAVADCIS